MNTGPDVFPHQFPKRSLKTEQIMFAEILKYCNSVCYSSDSSQCEKRAEKVILSENIQLKILLDV